MGKKTKEKYLLQKKLYYQLNKAKIKKERKKNYQNNKIEILKRNKEYCKNHKNKIKINKKEYYDKHKEKIQAQKRDYYENNKEKINKQNREYRKNNRKKINEYKNNKLKTDINFKISCALRNRLNHAIKGNFKSGSAVKDLGCTIPELKLRLESMFQPGMSWDNWSLTGWHIDHIIPLYSFDLSNREEFLKAVNYTNLRPLWAEENIKNLER